MGALPPHGGRADGEHVVAVGHLLGDEPVHLLVLEHEDRVGIAHRGLEQAVGVGGRARNDHLDAGHVGVERLDRLGVVEPAVDAAAERRADHHRHRPVAVGPVPGAGRLADDLVERRVDEVGELDLGDRQEAVQRGADGDADDARLGERRVQDARLAEPGMQPVGGTEDATLAPDVLAHDEHALVPLHLFGDRGADRFDHAHLGHSQIVARTKEVRLEGKGRALDSDGKGGG